MRPLAFVNSQWPALLLLSLALGACRTPLGEATSERRPAPLTEVVPGELLNQDVRQETIDATICTPGYTASVSPSTSFTNGVKANLMREAGIAPEAAASLELDHRVSLSVGGHPRHLANLQLQPWEGEDGAKRKDRLERRLQTLVCSRQLTLAQAQWALYSDWPAAYKRFMPGA